MKDAMKCAKRSAAFLLALAVLVQPAVGPGLNAYVLNRNIAAAGSCPVLQRWAASTPGIVARRWSTSIPLVNSVPTVFTDITAVPGDTVTSQIDRGIRNSFDVWTGVGTNLTPTSLGNLAQTAVQNACSLTDGIGTVCFNQADIVGFQTGVLAFTRVNSWDQVGPTNIPGRSATFVGEIIDADIQFRPDGQFTFATREALAAHPNSFDLESVLIHELGHFFGFSHSAVLRAMMYPFASRGTSTGGVRCPTPNTGCDLPLADDDRAGMRVLYPSTPPDPNFGSISGFILPANPLTLAGLPSATAIQGGPARPVTGIFGAHVVAVDAATGAVVAGTLGGWSCNQGQQLPSNFDGFYKIEGLPVGRSYKMFVEPLDGPTTAGDIQNAVNALCSQNTNNDVCTPPTVNTGFTTKIKPQ